MATHPFSLIVDDFGIEYVGKEHAHPLASVLKKYHNITQDWTGTKYSGIDVACNYKARIRTCRLKMDSYIFVTGGTTSTWN